MKPYETDDELERALFALPLEEPPANLRASILAATIYREPVQVKTWEIWAFGALCAILTWILVLVARGNAGPAFETISGYLNQALALLVQPQTLFWIALGGGAALWVSQLNLTPAPGALRSSRR